MSEGSKPGGGSPAVRWGRIALRVAWIIIKVVLITAMLRQDTANFVYAGF